MFFGDLAALSTSSLVTGKKPKNHSKENEKWALEVPWSVEESPWNTCSELYWTPEWTRSGSSETEKTSPPIKTLLKLLLLQPASSLGLRQHAAASSLHLLNSASKYFILSFLLNLTTCLQITLYLSFTWTSKRNFLERQYSLLFSLEALTSSREAYAELPFLKTSFPLHYRSESIFCISNLSKEYDSEKLTNFYLRKPFFFLCIYISKFRSNGEAEVSIVFFSGH